MTAWIKTLLNSLDAHVDASTRKAVMGACGEKCPFTHLTDERLLEIKENSAGDIDFLESLCRQWRLKNENGQYFVVFDRCYCPLVNEDIREASKTLCYCTQGNLEHKFRLGLDRRVSVDMEKTILAGDDECRFRITFQI